MNYSYYVNIDTGKIKRKPKGKDSYDIQGRTSAYIAFNTVNPAVALVDKNTPLMRSLSDGMMTGVYPANAESKDLPKNFFKNETLTPVTPLYKIEFNSGGSTLKADADVPLFVLLEYLEMPFSPDVIDKENIVAYGRKIRIDEKLLKIGKLKAEGRSDVQEALRAADTIGWLVNKDGTKGTPVRLSDLADKNGFSSNLSREQDKGLSGVHLRRFPIAESESAGKILKGDNSMLRADLLPQVIVPHLDCVVVFNSPEAAHVDFSAGSTDKAALLGITIKADMYSNGLFGDWINTQDGKGLSWWSKEIVSEGYPNYVLMGSSIANLVKDSYSFELNRDGYLSLDLDTIVRINADQNKERTAAGVSLLRTILLLIGFMFIFYTMLLFGSWALDTQSDVGLNLLEKITFRHLVAVRAKTDIPEYSPGSHTTYADLSRIIFIALGFALFGVTFIIGDPLGFIVRIFEFFGSILDIAGKFILGK